jgi:cation transport ATPase
VLAIATSAAAAVILTARTWDVVATILGTASSFALLPLWALARSATLNVVQRSFESGARFTDARAVSVALRTNVLVFAGRAGLLCLPPTVLTIEQVPRRDDETALSKEQLLAVIAGAEEAAPPSPLKESLLAAVKGSPVETLRSANYREGAGIVGERHTGERVLVGSRALLLEHHISTAVSEVATRPPGTRTIHVAIGKRLVGYLIVEEAPRAQAHPTIARLLDARIEPVLISSETREVCETLGATLELEHLRAEIEYDARDAEIRLLVEAGHIVAAVGHPVHDASILSGAELAFLRPTHGSEILPPNFPATVQLLTDDLRSLATALTEAKQLADRLKRALLAVLAPAMMATLAVTFGIAPLAVAPIGAMVGGLLILSPLIFPTHRDGGKA